MIFQKNTIEDYKDIARQRKGECLSTEYVSCETKLKWKCEHGHEWEARPSNIKKGHWCPFCGFIKVGKQKRLGIEEMHQLAKSKSGQCLSTGYVNSKTNLKWKCEHGHEWETAPNNIKRGVWCPICAGNKKSTIEEMQEIARQRNGECLSTEYINIDTKLKWRCEHGHEWEAIPYTIKKGHWCPVCAGNKKSTIEEMQKIARQRNGQCLSTEYVNDTTKLKWKCVHGHKWEAVPSHIKQGTWCPKCAGSIGERICREYFENIFDCEFPKSYPKWLISDKGNQLELDGYCESKAIAFEHHGQQHYRIAGHFHKQESDFNSQLERDAEKEKLCVNHGVKLIIVPAIPSLTPLTEVFPFLKNEFEKLGIEITKSEDELNINWTKIYASPQNEQFLEIQEIAKSKRGQCLSTGYVNAITRLKFKCKQGHEWEATPNNIKRGKWCPDCAIDNKKDTIEEMRKLAKSRNGECLSSEYVHSKTKLTWKCEHGHEWETEPRNIKSGYWCPRCSRNRSNKKLEI